MRRGPKGQARRGRRLGSRPAYSGKWSDEDDVADHHHELPPWQVCVRPLVPMYSQQKALQQCELVKHLRVFLSPKTLTCT